MATRGNSEDTITTSGMGVKVATQRTPRNKKDAKKWKKNEKRKLQALGKAFSGTAVGGKGNE